MIEKTYNFNYEGKEKESKYDSDRLCKVIVKKLGGILLDEMFNDDRTMRVYLLPKSETLIVNHFRRIPPTLKIAVQEKNQLEKILEELKKQEFRLNK